MKLFAAALQLFRAAAEAPEESDESDLHQTDNREQEEDRGIHSLGDRVRTAETDRAGGRELGPRHDCQHKPAFGVRCLGTAFKEAASRTPKSHDRSFNFRNALPAY